jgi:hypothetical protein
MVTPPFDKTQPLDTIVPSTVGRGSTIPVLKKSIIFQRKTAPTRVPTAKYSPQINNIRSVQMLDPELGSSLSNFFRMYKDLEYLVIAVYNINGYKMTKRTPASSGHPDASGGFCSFFPNMWTSVHAANVSPCNAKLIKLPKRKLWMQRMLLAARPYFLRESVASCSSSFKDSLLLLTMMSGCFMLSPALSSVRSLSLKMEAV